MSSVSSPRERECTLSAMKEAVFGLLLAGLGPAVTPPEHVVSDPLDCVRILVAMAQCNPATVWVAGVR